MPLLFLPQPPPTSSILGAPPISKLTNFPPSVGSSILGNAPQMGGGPRMVGPNILPSQPPQPPLPPPSGNQASILGQPPAPSINPHIFNAPPMAPAPGQPNFPPKHPNQPMFGQFDGNQPSPGVLQPPMPPFGIMFPGTPPGQQNFVGQPNQSFIGGAKEYLPGSLESGPFLPNTISQQPMINQALPPPGGTNEVSRFGVPLMKVGKTEHDASESLLGGSSGSQNIPLPQMLMTSEASSFDSAPHPQIVQGNVFGMGVQQPQPGGLIPIPQDTGTNSLLGTFSGSNLDLFPTFLPMAEPSTTNTGTSTHSAIMMVPPSVFSTVASSNSSHDPGSGDNLLPIGTERANKGTIAGGEVNAAAAGNSSSFSMLAPGECVSVCVGGGG